MSALNRYLCESNGSDMFAILSLAILSVHDGRMTLLNGSHPPPLLSRQGGPFEVVNGAKGTFWGSPQVRFQGVEPTLARVTASSCTATA